MCDLLRYLKGKLEVFRRRGFPRLDGFCVGHPVERIVDFNTVQPTRVVPEKLLFGKIWRIKYRLPFFITETRRAEPNPRHSWHYRSAQFPNLVIIEPASIRANHRFSAFLCAVFNMATINLDPCNLL